MEPDFMCGESCQAECDAEIDALKAAAGEAIGHVFVLLEELKTKQETIKKAVEIIKALTDEVEEARRTTNGVMRMYADKKEAYRQERESHRKQIAELNYQLDVLRKAQMDVAEAIGVPRRMYNGEEDDKS